ncbi:MAG: hypothetical protein KDI71_01840, partial [Xanthomonadales bacterium]|nr:hypothetical protein [Xanthomonadales bacterium]
MNKPISNTTTRNRLTGWLSQLMVFAAVVAVSIVSDWVPHRAIAAQANVQAFVDQQRMVLARDARIAAVSDRLEEIAEQL